MTQTDAADGPDAFARAGTGSEAVAEAMRQIDPDVVCACATAPQTEAVRIYAQLVADGKVGTEFVTLESERSAMSAAIGSAAGGARTMTATSSQDLASMREVLCVAASGRLPVVTTAVDRALPGTANAHCDHPGSMGGRDTGWVQLYGEDQQEAYDNCVMAVRIAEHDDVRLPVMNVLDGDAVSGTTGPLATLADEEVKTFVGPYRPTDPPLGVEHPVRGWPFDGLQDFCFEHTVAHDQAMDRALQVIRDVAEEYAEVSGRRYGLLDPYCLDDAEMAIVVVGPTAGTTRVVVDTLRAGGVKAGMVRVRVLRPFPFEECARALQHIGIVGVLDRADSLGAQGGPVFLEVRSALYDHDPRPQVLPFIHGLGDRDASPNDIERAFAALRRAAGSKRRTPVGRHYLDPRGD